MIEFSALFEQIVSRIDNKLSLIDQNGSQYLVCDVKYARKGKLVTGKTSDNNIISIAITNVDYENNIITLANSQIEKDLELQQPTSITGTKMSTNIEWTKMSKDIRTKTPFIWLLDNYTETEYDDQFSLERDIDCTIFFLDETNIKDFFTSDHKREVVQPMINLSKEFMNAVKKWRIFKTPETQNRKDLTKFGTESENGFVKNILDANLSGTLLTLKLSKYKDLCKC